MINDCYSRVFHRRDLKKKRIKIKKKIFGGLSRDLNPGPRAPEARIIPLDQRATSSVMTQFERVSSSTINSLWAGSC